MNSERTSASDSIGRVDTNVTSNNVDVLALWSARAEQQTGKQDHDVTTIFGSLDFDFDTADDDEDDSSETQDSLKINSDALADDDPMPSPPPQKIADSISVLQKSNNPDDKALAEALLKLFSRDVEHTDADKVTDSELILELAERNQPPLDKKALVGLLTKLDIRDHRHALLALHESGTAPDAVKEIAGLLRSVNPKDNFAAEVLLMFSVSDEPSKKQLFNDMISMLKQPESRADAMSLLTAPFPFTTEQMSQMIDLRKNGSQEHYKQLLDLIVTATGEPSPVDAARGLLSLRTADPKQFERMMKLVGSERREDALRIITIFHEPEHVAQLLDIAEKPENKKALEALLTNPHSAKEVLDLRGSALPADKTMAQALLDNLNGSDQQRSDALHLLGIGDRTQRERALQLLQDPVTAPGIRYIFELRDDAAKNGSSRRTNRAFDNATELLNYATRSGKGNRDQTFIKLLGGSAEDKAFTVKAFFGNERRTFEVIMSAMNSSETAESGRTLARLTDGPGGATAGELLVATKNIDPKLYNKVLKQLASSPEELEEMRKVLNVVGDERATWLLKMYVDPNRRDLYRTIASDLTGSDPKMAEVSQRLLSRLDDLPEARQDKSQSDDNNNASLASAAELEGLYSDPQTRELARAILSHSGSREEIGRLVKIFSGSDNAQLSRDAISFLKQKPGLASAFFSSFQNASQIRTFLEIFNDKDKGTAAAVLCDMLGVTTRPVANLMTMLTSKSQAEVNLGKSLVDMLNTTRDGTPLDPKGYNSWLEGTDTTQRARARQLLRSGLSAEAISHLNKSLDADWENPNNYDAGERASKILEIARRRPDLSTHISEMVTNLYSDNEQQRKVGKRLFDLLTAEPDLATTILTRGAPPRGPSIQSVFGIADTQAKLRVVGKLLEMRDEPRRRRDPDLPPPPQPSLSSAAVLKMISDPRTADGARMIIDLLANPTTASKGQTLIDALSMGKESGTTEFLRLFTAPKNDRERALKPILADLIENSSEPGSRQALENLAKLLSTEDNETFKIVADMLLDPARKDKALDALKKLTLEVSCDAFFKLISNPATMPAAEAVLDMLRNGSSKDISRIEAALADASGPEPSWIVKMLNNPETREIGKALVLLSTDTSKNRVQRLYEDEQKRPLLLDLIAKGKADKEFNSVVEQMLDVVSFEHFKSMYDMLQSRENQDLARQILSMARSEINTENRVGRQLVRLLSTGMSPEEGRALLARFKSSEEERPYLAALSGFEAEEVRRLEKRLTAPGNEQARLFFLEMFDDSGTLEGNSKTALPVFQELLALEKSDPTKAEGIWRMINDPRHQQSARRAFETLRKPF